MLTFIIIYFIGLAGAIIFIDMNNRFEDRRGDFWI